MTSRIWPAAIVGIPVLFCGLALLLVAHLRRPALPRWKRSLLFVVFALFVATLLWVVFGANV
jgi:Ca2+/Na+ antiporter